jgi:hypothetical protein
MARFVQVCAKAVHPVPRHQKDGLDVSAAGLHFIRLYEDGKRQNDHLLYAEALEWLSLFRR